MEMVSLDNISVKEMQMYNWTFFSAFGRFVVTVDHLHIIYL